MNEVLSIKGGSDCCNTTVHHIGRCHHISTCLCMDQRLIGQDRHGLIIHHIAITIDQTILPMAGIRIKC